MLFLDLGATVECMYRAVAGSAGDDVDEKTLRRRYLALLRTDLNIPISVADCPRVSFGGDPLEERAIAIGLIELNDDIRKVPLSADERASIQGQIHAAIRYIETLEADLAALFHLIIGDIFVVNTTKQGSGTSSKLLGAIWMNPTRDWSLQRYAEVLVHETIHNNLFLLELVNPFFVAPALVNDESHFALSAIKVGQMRPLDRAIHSCCVAVGVAYFYDLASEPAMRAHTMLHVEESARSIMLQEALLTDFARQIMHEVLDFARSPDFETLSR